MEVTFLDPVRRNEKMALDLRDNGNGIMVKTTNTSHGKSCNTKSTVQSPIAELLTSEVGFTD
jgi:hypothetical protein